MDSRIFKQCCRMGIIMDSQTFSFLLGWIIGVLSMLTYDVLDKVKKEKLKKVLDILKLY